MIVKKLMPLILLSLSFCSVQASNYQETDGRATRAELFKQAYGILNTMESNLKVESQELLIEKRKTEVRPQPEKTSSFKRAYAAIDKLEDLYKSIQKRAQETRD